MSGEATVKGAFRKPVRIDADEERAFVLHGSRVVMLMEPRRCGGVRRVEAVLLRVFGV